MAYLEMAYLGIACIVIACVVIAYIVIAYLVMAYLVMAYLVMTYLVTVWRKLLSLSKVSSPHLVLSVSQIQTSGGLLILNSQQQQQQQQHHQDLLHHHHHQQQQLNGVHPSEQPLLASECGNGISSAVVRSLTALSDFESGNNATPVNNGFDFSASDSLLTESKVKEPVQPQQQQQQQPLLDFKSAFTTDGKNPASELGFLHLDMESNSHPTTHPVDLNPMDFIENETVVAGQQQQSQQQQQPQHHFDMDPFDLMNDFPEMHHSYNQMIENNNRKQQQLNNNNNNNLESSRNNGESLVQISDYSPEWSWSDVRTHFYYFFTIISAKSRLQKKIYYFLLK